MDHLVYHVAQYFLPSTINHYIPITSENAEMDSLGFYFGTIHTD